ncbi:helix-turn-helix domain-containing protein [Amycolatopsis orientalis]|uniref:helix-turn-helix domain-containing protein n=1 Tax=Amycolatopsis orientalis TaxID=31958 RepID=UPI00055DD937|nr:helix-turn-helix transcriptional regulator [Amycolatopsis orientalis]
MEAALDSPAEVAAVVAVRGMDVDGCETVEAADERVAATARFLLERRRELGLSQAGVSRRAGINRTTLGRLERGEEPLCSVVFASGLARALNASPYALALTAADGTGQPEPREGFNSFVDELHVFGGSRMRAPKCLAQLAFALRMRARKLCCEAAEDAGLHPATWGQVELGKLHPSIPMLVGMGQAVAWDLPVCRRQLLLIAVRDQVDREECAQRGETWDPGWRRPAKVRQPADWPASARTQNGG